MSNEKEQSVFEKLGGKYIKVGDYYVLDFGQFDDDEDETDDRLLGKYGMMRKTYLKGHHNPLYNHLLLSGKLHTHLCDVNEEAVNMLDRLFIQYKASQGVTEDMKATNQFEWVG